MAHEDLRGQRECGTVGTWRFSSKTGPCGLSKAPKDQFFSDTLRTEKYSWAMFDECIFIEFPTYPESP